MKKNKLDILKKQGSGFKTPKGYFDTIDDHLMSEILTKKLPKKAGFTAPKNYFNTFENQIFKRITRASITNQEQFDVPQNYFETIEDKVFEKIQKAAIVKPKVIRLKPLFIKVIAPIAVAASLFLIFMFNYTLTKEDYSFDNLAAADVENWIENDLVILESYTISEVFNDVSLEEELNEDDLELLNYISGTDIESALLTN